MMNPLVSIIVTTKNSESTVEECLLSIKEQTYSPLEMIVIDNHSSDRTIKIAKKYTQHIFQIGPERSTQRNMGIKKAKGEYVLFLDSDMYLNHEVVAECVKIIKDKTIKGIYIPEKIESNSYWIKVRNFERSFYNQTVVDAVRFISKKNAEAIGGFDETLFAGEDWDFDKRIRKLGKTGISTSCLFHNEMNFSISEYLRKKAYYAPNLDVYRNKWKNDSEVQKQFSIMYRYIIVFIENGKWKQLIKHLDLAVGMFFLRLLVGLTYLTNRHSELASESK